MTNFQKMTRQHNAGGMSGQVGKRNRRRVVLAIACALMTVTAVGCGKAEEPAPVDLSSGNMEELQNETGEDSGANGADGKDEENFENDVAEEAGADAKDGAENGTPEKAGQNTDGEDGTGAQSAGNEQLEGDVQSVESDSFVICKHDTWVEDGVSYAVAPAPGYEEESDLVTIHMAENCVYQYETVKNSGINPEDVSSREGSLADLEEGLAVTIKGKWQTDGSFLADSIVMMSIE